MVMDEKVVRIIEPMLCSAGTVRDIERCEAERARKGVGWWAEQKFDGVRATIQNGRIYDRRGKDITVRFPEFKDVEKIMGFMDGEIVSKSGDFSEVAGRMHLRDKAKRRLLARLSPCQFVYWWYGLPVWDDSRSQYGAAMWDWAKALSAKPSWLSRAEAGQPLEMWLKAEREGWEGIILKCRVTYQSGVRSPGWIKVKRFVEVTHRFSKIEHTPTGVVLEDEVGHRVAVNGSEAKSCKSDMEKKGYVDAQVQYLPQKESGAWRFPSFRGRVEEKDGKDNI